MQQNVTIFQGALPEQQNEANRLLALERRKQRQIEHDRDIAASQATSQQKIRRVSEPLKQPMSFELLVRMDANRQAAFQKRIQKIKGDQSLLTANDAKLEDPKISSALKAVALQENFELTKKFRSLAFFDQRQVEARNEEKRNGDWPEFIQQRLDAAATDPQPKADGPVFNYFHITHDVGLYRKDTSNLVLKVLEIRKLINMPTTGNIAAISLCFKNNDSPILVGAGSAGPAGMQHSERIALCKAINQAISEKKVGFAELLPLGDFELYKEKDKLRIKLNEYAKALADFCSEINIYSDRGACLWVPSVTDKPNDNCVEFFKAMLPTWARFFFGIPYFRGFMSDTKVLSTLEKQIEWALDCVNWEKANLSNILLETLQAANTSLSFHAGSGSVPFLPERADSVVSSSDNNSTNLSSSTNSFLSSLSGGHMPTSSSSSGFPNSSFSSLSSLSSNNFNSSLSSSPALSNNSSPNSSSFSSFSTSR